MRCAVIDLKNETKEKSVKLRRGGSYPHERHMSNNFMIDENFMIDVENEILRACGSASFPKRQRRIRHAAWVKHVKACLAEWYGGGKAPVSRREGGLDEVSWKEYVVWVEKGGGDEWFTSHSSSLGQ